MRPGLIAGVVLAGAVLAAPAGAAPTAQVLVVGSEGVLSGPRTVPLRATTVRAGGRSCRILGTTPLAALARTGLSLRIRDLGSCGRDPRDAGALYVAQIGTEREKGRGGWVYKVGRKAGTTSASDAAGSFGTGRRLRGGERILWFWCELDRGDACQRTLEASPSATSAAPGSTIRVTVRGYDDRGRGVPIEGATVRIGDGTSTTGADGVAAVKLSSTPGTFSMVAEKDGLVRSFPRRVRVG